MSLVLLGLSSGTPRFLLLGFSPGEQELPPLGRPVCALATITQAFGGIASITPAITAEATIERCT